MCGITGWVDFKNPLTHETKTVEKMAAVLKKRGPDAMTTWRTDHVVFGHTRLIVIDPAGGAQPMTRTKDGCQYTLCYNGELYNTEEVRKELAGHGFTFHSHSDTEVLLTAYMHWGEACLEKLNGIFAFAVWDGKKNTLFLARDRLGVKPLFYYEYEHGLLFGSEIKAILAHPAVKAAVGEDGWQEVFGLSPSRTPGHGVFHGIKELKPAHSMSASERGAVTNRYWQVVSGRHTDTEEETAAHIRMLLKDAVERQLVADVPVCTFLSGGLDSSSISAFSAAHFKKKQRSPLQTFSIDYEENDLFFKSSTFQPDADAPWVKKVSEALDTTHRSCMISQNDLFQSLRSAVLARDLPGMADIDSSLLWFSGELKKHVTVGLSGECADEIFGGYPWFHDKDKLTGDIFPWMSGITEREQLLRPEYRQKLNIKQYVKVRYKETLDEAPALDGETGVDAARRAMFYVNMIWFMTTLLERKDRMSMAQSLEVRVPFADHNLVQYVWNIPWDMKMLKGREKGILRYALRGVLPDDVLYRKKSPYPKTHHPEYKRLVSEALLSLVEKKESPLFDKLDYGKVKELAESGGASFKKPYFGQLMTGPQLIAYLLQLDIWMREYGVA